MPAEPDATIESDALALVHRGWEHLMLQRPLAAWASWQQALRARPGDPAATQALERLEGSEVLPLAARVEYRFHPPDRDDRRSRWDAAFRVRTMTDLADASDAFRELVEADPEDASALYNRGLCLSWLGRNAEAIAALDGFVRLAATTRPEPAIDAWTLAEVLRHGAGAEHLADDLSATARLPWPDDRQDVEPLDEAGRIHMHPVSIDPSTGRAADPDTAAYEWLDRPLPDPSEIRSSDDLPIGLGTIVRRPGMLEISTPRPRNRLAIEERLARATGGAGLPIDWSLTPLPLRFLDAATWTFRFPPGTPDDERHRLTREAVERYHEEEWVHMPRIGLGPAVGGPGSTPRPRSPLDTGRHAAGGDEVARVKLEAVIRLREQLASRPHMAALSSGYPFDRLRRRVGLAPREPSNVDPADLSCASEAELARLDIAALDRSALVEACRSALALGLDELAARCEEALSRRVPEESPTSKVDDHSERTP